MLKNYGIVLASGSGSRFGADIPKQFVKILGKTILEWCIDAFEISDKIDGIVVVITPEYLQKAKEIISQNNYKKILKVVAGGAQRKDSSFIGISCINDEEANIFIHDCARPLVSQKIISDCAESMRSNQACTVAIPSSDTIYIVNEDKIQSIPNRKNLMRAQTPQCFKLSLIKKAHELSKNDTNFTDDCGLVEKYNLAPITIIQGSEENIKITYPDDVYLAEKIIKNRM